MLNTHPMTWAFTDNGVERWICLICGRELDIVWEPWKSVVVEEGDSTVSHAGGKSGLRMNAEVEST